MSFLEVLVRFLFIMFSFVLWHLMYYFVGRLLYRLGFKRIGHCMVAVSIAGDFGLFKQTRKWLKDHCCYEEKPETKRCNLWTCDNYVRCPYTKRIK